MKLGPIVVTDATPLWIRLVFAELGRHHSTIGLRHDIAVVSPADRLELSGYREIPMHLPQRTFGRLGGMLGAWAALRVRAATGRPGAIVYTFPSHRVYLPWFKNIPSFYYVSDDFSQNYGFHPIQVLNWECRLVNQVRHIFAVSEALADRLSQRYGVCRDKFTIVPNGLPQKMIPLRPPDGPAAAPSPIPAHFRPLIGVLGGINKRLRLNWLLEAVEALPWSYWAFVGPIGEFDEASAPALAALQAHPRCCFTGGQTYERLFEFAASFDVAVLPFEKNAFNDVCSPVRFFTQLPFGRPVLAFPGCDQLERNYREMIQIISSAESFILALEVLKKKKFKCELGARHWMQSHKETWSNRAEIIFKKMVTICGL